nr:hypothetical protein [Tanacetum cinerariifolium]
MPSKDNLYNDFKKIDSPFQKISSLKPYVLNVILEKIIIDLEDEVVNLLEKEKVNLETIESLKSKSFESSKKVSSESENQSENDCLAIEKEYDKEENPKVIAPGIFKLNVSQCVSLISMSKSSCDSNNIKIKLKRKRRKRKSSKQNVKQVDNDVSRANSNFVHFSDLDTFSNVRRPKNSGVIWKKKGSSNTSNVGLSVENPKVIAPGMFKLKRRKIKSSKQNVKQVDSDVSHANSDFVHFSDLDIFGSVRRPKNIGVIWKKKGSSNTSNVGLSAVNVSNLNKNVKRYSRKDLMNDFLDDNNFFIFDDVIVRISPVSKMPFRKKPRDSMHVRSKSNMIKSLPRTVHKWLPKLQTLAELVAK